LKDNFNLSNRERNWINQLLSHDFPGKENIILQLENAIVSRQYTSGYLSLKFSIDGSIPSVEISKSVPVEMRVFKDGQSPIVFLLHVLNGYVSELEIYYADLSEIDENIDISNAEIQFVM